MTKTELQVALAQATQTNKKTAGVFLDTLGMLAYKEVKKTGEFVLPGFGKLVKCAHGIQSQDAAEDQDSSQDRRQIPQSPRRPRTRFSELRSSFGAGMQFTIQRKRGAV